MSCVKRWNTPKLKNFLWRSLRIDSLHPLPHEQPNRDKFVACGRGYRLPIATSAKTPVSVFSYFGPRHLVCCHAILKRRGIAKEGLQQMGSLWQIAARHRPSLRPQSIAVILDVDEQHRIAASRQPLVEDQNRGLDARIRIEDPGWQRHHGDQ